MTDNLTHPEAAEIAAQWASMMTAGDPGAIFYAFNFDHTAPDFDDAAWARALEHCDDCLTIARGYVERGEENIPGEDPADDVAALERLRAYIESKGHAPARTVEYAEAKREIAGNSGGDPWGWAMGWLFPIAAEIHFNRPDIEVPDELHYRPGAARGTESDCYEAETVAAFTDDALERLALVLNRYADFCKAKGLDY